MIRYLLFEDWENDHHIRLADGQIAEVSDPDFSGIVKITPDPQTDPLVELPNTFANTITETKLEKYKRCFRVFDSVQTEHGIAFFAYAKDIPLFTKAFFKDAYNEGLIINRRNRNKLWSIVVSRGDLKTIAFFLNRHFNDWLPINIISVLANVEPKKQVYWKHTIKYYCKKNGYEIEDFKG